VPSGARIVSQLRSASAISTSSTAGRFLDPAREPEYRMTGTYAAGYVNDYFPGIEGLAMLYQTTHDERYLRQAEQMASFLGFRE